MFFSTNPYTGKRILEFEYHSTQQVKDALTSLVHAHEGWKKRSTVQRVGDIEAVKTSLLKHKDKAAKLISTEMGKPISESYAEIDKCVNLCEYYAKVSVDFLADKTINSAKNSWVIYEPLGIILGIMPWNFPFWQVFRFAVPTILAGNMVVVKHALNIPECAQLIEEIFTEAIPEFKPYKNLFLTNKNTENLIANDHIKGVSLTGSTNAGRAVAAAAGKEIKPVILELGGSNALVVFKDADIEKTVDICVKSRFLNNGQSCIAGKRLLIAEDIRTPFMKLLIEKIKTLKSGDPLDVTSQISVLAKREFVMDLDQQLTQSISMGALLLLGGKSNEYHFEPTVVSNVTPEMPLFKQETFGPVLAVTTFKTVEQAIELANSTDYGLGVSLFSQDITYMKSLVSKFQDGAVFINALVKSFPALPFGGSKTSGVGRELSEEGLKAFVNVKTVVIG
ncbi:aldehyde dehydrogenase family protein [Aquimarina agarivorans]|uniref:aldehyde dehydrogenase family protein n=1 Tax=Aquimarina agarivorans TaxID=980584 RepID=UPI000248E7E3|nr:aldehyde dehydrogenase family protein [Aquimarina agarivorans]